MRRRLSRSDLISLYTAALEMRDEARRELADSRAVCRSQATEIGRLHDELTAAKAPAARSGETAELARAKRTIAALDEQLRVLEASNLEFSRQAMRHAGTAVQA
jgi:hypothetical protein